MTTNKLDGVLAHARTFTAIADHQRVLHHAHDLAEVVAAARRALAGGAAAVTVYDDLSGQRTEVEAEGAIEAIAGRLGTTLPDEKRAGPGRPKLGVVSREVSLLPRQWDWLNAQPGGASAALRRLIDDAGKRQRARDAARVARDAVYRPMAALAGDLPGYEEALRALYANDFARVQAGLAGWPADLAAYLGRLVETAAALHALAEEEASVVKPS